jgi:hypothetical protein
MEYVVIGFFFYFFWSQGRRDGINATLHYFKQKGLIDYD